jgi:hypothetical protein
VPTFDVRVSFWDDYRKLTREQRELFRKARREFIEDCDGGRFRPSLRVHPMRSHNGIWEMTWEGNDGRATFAWGPEQSPGKRHVIWRRVGGHEIYANP